MFGNERDSLEVGDSFSSSESRPFLSEKDDEQQLLPTSNVVPLRPPVESMRLSAKCWLSIVANCLATVGIVFVNKRIFEDASLRRAQVSFAAFHFALTSALLYIVSHPQINLFQARRFDPITILPLALAMIANVVLPNASLAFSSIQFYQVARVLLTPVVALLNYLLYRQRIPRPAALTLVPVCLGVGIVSYFDAAVPAPRAAGSSSSTTMTTTTTQPLGVLFAFAGVLASSIYTVWIKKYHDVLQCSSMQLLLNQAPISVLVMLYIIPFSDDVTVLRTTRLASWMLIQLSGLFACVINLSQFVIINEAGPVSSTVVGHFKTCSVVAMGWIVSRKPLTDGSLVGIVLAVGGIIAYQHAIQKHARK